MTGPRILLSATALDRFGDELRAISPDAVWLTIDDEGAILADGTPIERAEAEPEVAWLTPDLVQGGAIRPFFGIVVRAAGLRWLQSSAAGFDAPIFADLVRRGVRLTTSHIAGPPIADVVVRAALDHLQDAGEWRRAQAEHRWAPHDFVEMNDTTWLIVGLGSIGAEIAVRARAFGARVVGVRRSPVGDEPVDAMIGPDQVHAHLADADVVVLATPATGGNAGLVDAGFLAAMRPGSLLANVGRGSLVDEEALVAALDAGRPGRAYLDVTATEPLPADSPLWDHPRIELTPHSSALGHGRHVRAAEVFVANLERYLAAEPLRHEVGPDDVG